MFSWFTKLFKKEQKMSYHKPTKKLPLFRLKDIANEAYLHAIMDDMNGKEHIGPYAKRKEQYIEFYRYFCSIMQKALMEGKRVPLPGIGSIQLVRRKERILHNKLVGRPIKVESNVYLKAFISKESKRRFLNKADV